MVNGLSGQRMLIALFLGTALAAGLVITHSLVPPTPGPLGVCEAKDQLTIRSITSTIAWAVGVVEVIVLSIFLH